MLDSLGFVLFIFCVIREFCVLKTPWLHSEPNTGILEIVIIFLAYSYEEFLWPLKQKVNYSHSEMNSQFLFYEKKLLHQTRE